jgi:hypothetical protein
MATTKKKKRRTVTPQKRAEISQYAPILIGRGERSKYRPQKIGANDCLRPFTASTYSPSEKLLLTPDFYAI